MLKNLILMEFSFLQRFQIEKEKQIHRLMLLKIVQSKSNNYQSNNNDQHIKFSDISTMGEDDLVSYRQYTVHGAGTSRTTKKRPAPAASPSAQRENTKTFQHESDLDDDCPSKTRVSIAV